jgi:hypothetical protein
VSIEDKGCPCGDVEARYAVRGPLSTINDTHRHSIDHGEPSVGGCATSHGSEESTTSREEGLRLKESVCQSERRKRSLFGEERDERNLGILSPD